MRRYVPGVLAGLALACLVIALWPLQTETRLVGLAGFVVLGGLYAFERRYPRNGGGADPG